MRNKTANADLKTKQKCSCLTIKIALKTQQYNQDSKVSDTKNLKYDLKADPSRDFG